MASRRLRLRAGTVVVAGLAAPPVAIALSLVRITDLQLSASAAGGGSPRQSVPLGFDASQYLSASAGGGS